LLRRGRQARNLKRVQWYIALSLLLVGTSVIFYLVQIALFHRGEDTFFYLFQDLAFVPIQVLLVTLIIAKLLQESEKRALLKKLNMLIGAFFSEVGAELLKYLSHFSGEFTDLAPHLLVRPDWSRKDFANAERFVKTLEPRLDARRNDLTNLRHFLAGKRNFLLSLLANPNLLEHAAFTDLLWAVLHLSEELTARPGLNDLPASDYEHLSGDIERAYLQLLSQWLAYLRHLKENYPYLFSLAVRTNPLDREANPVVKK
jgi:hypothetical protein